MTIRFVLPVLALSLLATAPGRAQVQAQVTLNVPVNLSQYGPDATKIQVGCAIWSDAITNGTGTTTGTGIHLISKTTELPMTGGAISTTVPLVFNFTALDNPTGKTAYYQCSLMGWSASTQQWIQFAGGSGTPTSFRTNGASIGYMDPQTFVW